MCNHIGFFYVSIFLSKLIVFLGFCISCLICVKLFMYKRGPSKLVNLLHNPSRSSVVVIAAVVVVIVVIIIVLIIIIIISSSSSSTTTSSSSSKPTY